MSGNNFTDAKKSFFVVTVPHATCPPREGFAKHIFFPSSKNCQDEEAWRSTGNHACDFSGPPAGQQLKLALERRGRVVKILEAPVPRTTLDMNRKWSRSSEWRREVASVSRGAECLIDAHSYPAQYSSFGGADIVLLTEGEPETWQLEIEERLTRAAFKCSHTARHDTADLVADVHSRGVPAVLIEFSEGLSRERLKTATDVIAEYLCLPTMVGNCNGKCGQFAEIRSALVVRNNLVIGGPSNYTLSRNFGGSDGSVGAPYGQKRGRKERELEEESQLPESTTTEEEEEVPEKAELLWTHIQMAAGKRVYRCEGSRMAAQTFPTQLSLFHDTIEMATRALGNYISEVEEMIRSKAHRARMRILRRGGMDVERAEAAAAVLPSPEYVVRAYETLVPTKWIAAAVGSDSMSAAKEMGAVGVVDASLKKFAFAPQTVLPAVLARVPDFGLEMPRPWLTAIAPSLNLAAETADDWHGPETYRESNRMRLWSADLAKNFAAVGGNLLAYDEPSRTETQNILARYGIAGSNRSAQRAAAAIALCGDGLGAGNSLMRPWLAPKFIFLQKHRFFF